MEGRQGRKRAYAYAAVPSPGMNQAMNQHPSLLAYAHQTRPHLELHDVRMRITHPLIDQLARHDP